MQLRRGIVAIIWFAPVIAIAVSVIFRLPYPAGQKQLLTRGYFDQTHNGKDQYALDFADSGCRGWGSPVLAIADGVVIKTEEGHVHGEKNSYGNQVLIEHNDALVSRYAHLHTVDVGIGDVVTQATQIGTQGNTGSVWGSACKEYPGTHLHFVLYTKNADRLIPYKPEPLSGYKDFLPGQWYLSDNERIITNNLPVANTIPLNQEKESFSWWRKIWQKFLTLFGGSSDVAVVDTSYIPLEQLDRVSASSGVPVASTTPWQIKQVNENIRDSSTLPTFVSSPIQHIQKKFVSSTTYFSDVVPNVVVPLIDTIEEKTREITEEIKNSVPPLLGGFSEEEPPEVNQFEALPLPPVVNEQIPQESEPIFDEPSITILFPESSPFFTSSTSMVLLGYNNINTDAVLVNGSSDGVSYPSSTSWKKEISLQDGFNRLSIYGVTSGGIVSSSNTQDIILDRLGPVFTDVSSEIVSVPSGTLKLSWQAIDNNGIGIASYDIEEFVDDTWMPVVTATSTNSLLLTREPFRSYAFRVRAKDHLSNYSDWVSLADPLLLDYPRTVVFNEIAWMGTDAGHQNDEWIELYNPSDVDIDLSGWSIDVSGRLFTWKQTQQSIPANGYYLLERTDDTSVADIAADGIFTVNSGLKNTGEILTLRNELGEIVEQLDASRGWAAGDIGRFYKTMERVGYTGLTNDPRSWQTANGLGVRGLIEGGGQQPIYGTPKQSNNGFFLLKDVATFYEDQFIDNRWILGKDESPYIIDYETYIPEGKSIEVEPGVVFIGRSADAHIVVNGELHLLGSDDSPVTLTSLYDPLVVSSSDRTPQAGDWSHIEIGENGVVETNHTRFRYCGFSYTLGNDWVYGDRPFSQCISNFGGTLDVRNTQFSGGYIHPADNEFTSYIWLKSASTTIHGSEFYGGYRALAAYDSFIDVQDTLFHETQDIQGPVYLYNTLPTMHQNMFSENTFDGISLSHLEISDAYTLGPASAYKTGSILITDSGALTLAEGTTLFVQDRNDIVIRGQLHALGTENLPVIISSVKDYWGSLVFEGGSGNFQHTIIEKGNHGNYNSRFGGMIVADDSDISLDHVQLLDARRPYNMVFAKNTDITLRNSTLAWSTPKQQPNWVIVGIELQGGTITLDNTTFSRMDRGVNGQSQGYMENMDESFFTFISDTPWWPNELFLLPEESLPEIQQ